MRLSTFAQRTKTPCQIKKATCHPHNPAHFVSNSQQGFLSASASIDFHQPIKLSSIDGLPEYKPEIRAPFIPLAFGSSCQDACRSKTPCHCHSSIHTCIVGWSLAHLASNPVLSQSLTGFLDGLQGRASRRSDSSMKVPSPAWFRFAT